jgi:hypothetical protein
MIKIEAMAEIGISFKGSVCHQFIPSTTVVRRAFTKSNVDSISLEARYAGNSITLTFTFPVFDQTIKVTLDENKQSMEERVAVLWDLVVRQRITAKVSRKAEKAWTLSSRYHGADNWTDLTGASLPLDISKNDATVKYSLRVSVHTEGGHGGIRVVMDGGAKVWGSHPTYGLLWLAPSLSTWHHLYLVDFLNGVPVGKHTFTIQMKKTGGSLYVCEGEENNQYGRNYFSLKEL